MDGHRKGSLPTELVISVLGNSNPPAAGSARSTSTQPNQEVDSTSEEEVVSTNNDGVAKVHSSRRFVSSTKRSKSRNKSSLARVCSEEAATSSLKIKSARCTPSERIDRFSTSTPSLVPVDSDISGSSSSNRSRSDTKINHIFSMLQTMQQNFLLQQQQLQQAEQPIKERPIKEQMARAEMAITPVHSEPKAIQQRPQHLELEVTPSSQSSPHKHLMHFGRSRSRDSLMSAGEVSMMTKDKPYPMVKRKSWTGSQCSEITCQTVTTEEPPPHLIHSLPYHKDAW